MVIFWSTKSWDFNIWVFGERGHNSAHNCWPYKMSWIVFFPPLFPENHLCNFSVFSSETVWPWSFLWGKVFYNNSICLLFCFSLCLFWHVVNFKKFVFFIYVVEFVVVILFIVLCYYSSNVHNIYVDSQFVLSPCFKHHTHFKELKRKRIRKLFGYSGCLGLPWKA